MSIQQSARTVARNFFSPSLYNQPLRTLAGFSSSSSSSSSSSEEYSPSRRAAGVFDRGLKLRQRSAIASNHGNEGDVYYLREELGRRAVDILLDAKKTFPRVLDLSAGTGHILRALGPEHSIRHLTMLDGSKDALDVSPEKPHWLESLDKVVHDEDSGRLPFDDNSFDAVVTAGGLHWVNDLPELFAEVSRVLVPDGAFLGNLLGGDSLSELRSAFALAEQERDGGLSPHVSALAGVQDVGNLLGGAGFNLPTVVVEELPGHYGSPWVLMHDLREAGEGSVSVGRRDRTGRETMIAMAAVYEHMYGFSGFDPDSPEDSVVPATFEAVSWIAWTPHPSQPKPARRGSGTTHMSKLASGEAAASVASGTKSDVEMATGLSSIDELMAELGIAVDEDSTPADPKRLEGVFDAVAASFEEDDSTLPPLLRERLRKRRLERQAAEKDGSDGSDDN